MDKAAARRNLDRASKQYRIIWNLIAMHPGLANADEAFRLALADVKQAQDLYVKVTS